jgi:hypothetical protein
LLFQVPCWARRASLVVRLACGTNNVGGKLFCRFLLAASTEVKSSRAWALSSVMYLEDHNLRVLPRKSKPVQILRVHSKQRVGETTDSLKIQARVHVCRIGRTRRLSIFIYTTMSLPTSGGTNHMLTRDTRLNIRLATEHNTHGLKDISTNSSHQARRDLHSPTED